MSDRTRPGTARERTPYRTVARVATAVFLLVTAYTVVAKGFGGRLSEDWVHSALHVASAAVAAWAGWVARSPGPARWFTAALALVYLPLGLLGWLVPGFLLDTSFRGTSLAVPLGPADNVFHLLLGVPAAVVLLRGSTGRAGATARPG